MTNSLITQHHFYLRKEKLNPMFNVNKTALNRLLTTFLSLPDVTVTMSVAQILQHAVDQTTVRQQRGDSKCF